MRRVALVVLLLGLSAASIASYVVERDGNARVRDAFTRSGVIARKPAIAEAARLAPRSDLGAEMFAAAAGREWLSRHPGAPAAALVRERLSGRLPWGYPHPWRWPRGDYATEYLASVAELETPGAAAAGSDADLDRARSLMLDAVRAHPAWKQHHRTLEAAAIARGQ